MEELNVIWELLRKQNKYQHLFNHHIIIKPA